VNTATALLHPEFRMTLIRIANPCFGATHMEQQLARLALDLYDADPEHPQVVALVNRYTRDWLTIG